MLGGKKLNFSNLLHVVKSITRWLGVIPHATKEEPSIGFYFIRGLFNLVMYDTRAENKSLDNGSKHNIREFAYGA